jgi:predicted Fe-Mo cluster-binding NifX family protein
VLLKTAFSTNGYGIQDSIEPAFGRCKNFLVVESGGRSIQVVPNPGAASSGGAGVQAAETLIRLGIDKLVTGSVGPNARPLLEAAGIAIFTGQSGKISDQLPAASGNPEVATSPTTASLPRDEKAPGAYAGRKPAGYCLCQRCGYQTDDDSGLPCFKLKCPACGSTMERRFN